MELTIFQKISFEKCKIKVFITTLHIQKFSSLRLSIDMSNQIDMPHPNNNTENETNYPSSDEHYSSDDDFE